MTAISRYGRKVVSSRKIGSDTEGRKAREREFGDIQTILGKP